MTPAQLQTLKADILANADLNTNPNTSDGNFEIARLYNLTATPDFWVWKSSLAERECVEQASQDGTSFSWTQYIARTEPERDAWKRLFASGTVNPSLTNVRQGIADIFSGAQAAPTAQRAHLLATARRKATRAEKLFSTGTGSTASPAVTSLEFGVTAAEVDQARNLP
jgi:hypothetical protein